MALRFEPTTLLQVLVTTFSHQWKPSICPILVKRRRSSFFLLFLFSWLWEALTNYNNATLGVLVPLAKKFFFQTILPIFRNIGQKSGLRRPSDGAPSTIKKILTVFISKYKYIVIQPYFGQLFCSVLIIVWIYINQQKPSEYRWLWLKF